MASKIPDGDAEDDDELSDLLDSALDDFNKHLTAVGAAAPGPSAVGQQASTATAGATTKAEPLPSCRDSEPATAGAASAGVGSSVDSASSTSATAAVTSVAAAATGKSSASATKPKKKKKAAAAAAATDPGSSQEAEQWMKAFNDELRLAQEEFGSAMGQFSAGDPQFAAQFEDMMKGLDSASAGGAGAAPFPDLFSGAPPPGFPGVAATPSMSAAPNTGATATAASGGASAGASLQDQLAQTLSGMQENLKSSADMKGNPGEDEFMKLLQQQMTAGSESGSTSPNPMGGTGLIPMMETMMQTLLSPDVLYPSVKDLSAKLQEWLVAHEDDGTVAGDDRTRYSRQLDILRSVCSIYESNQDSDSDSVKKERYEQVLQLMQQMQEYGHPPSEVMKDLAPDMEVDGSGAPQFPGLPPLGGMGMPFPPTNGADGEQCIMM